MRVEQAERGPNDFLVGAVMDLALVTAVLLSMGSAPAPTTQAALSIEGARPAAAEPAHATSDGSSGTAIAR